MHTKRLFSNTVWSKYIIYLNGGSLMGSILKVLGASSRCLNAPPLCTDADGVFRCNVTVENLGDMGEPYILP